MLSAQEIDALAAKPLAVRRAYIACDCNTGGRGREACQSRHFVDSVPTKVCPECGDIGETHYLSVPATSDMWTGFYAARRGHDDDDPNCVDRCEGATVEVSV